MNKKNYIMLQLIIANIQTEDKLFVHMLQFTIISDKQKIFLKFDKIDQYLVLFIYYRMLPAEEVVDHGSGKLRLKK